MKNIVFVITLCLVPLASIAQEFHVINVKGSVAVVGRQGNLKSHDKIKADDKLKFSSPSDAVAVASTKSGRFVISPTVKSKDGELLSMVKDVITPGTKKLSTRSGLFNNALDFAQYFKDTVLLLPEMRYRTSFVQNEKSFFFVQYTYRTEKINKKLKNSGDTLIIQRSELFSVDGTPIAPSEVSGASLVYMSGSNMTTLAKIHMVSPDPAELADGIKVLKQLYPAKQVREEAISYLTELYGKIDEGNFDRWYKQR